ncbi:MAG TPA: hypothetical protein VJ698_02910 [Noviherbaspirillum sp.]|uniref:hypothetical protein n=1 Tax=Noviherbaspirillum sp. TaxID=1926288 RepID=UPI002B480599|nr:hypothetical protein [Noviherbaspirillum sp.]HJV84400.1 hypothetical protein [Noviherbaspirillum sp.]
MPAHQTVDEKRDLKNRLEMRIGDRLVLLLKEGAGISGSLGEGSGKLHFFQYPV